MKYGIQISTLWKHPRKRISSMFILVSAAFLNIEAASSKKGKPNKLRIDAKYGNAQSIIAYL
jgi:hypothetical protein